MRYEDGIAGASASMAILLDEPEAAARAEAFATNDRIVISAVTVAEALIVAGRRGLGAEMAGLAEGLELEIASVSPDAARRVADAYARWGRGLHLAGLNFCDCFAHDVARTRDYPLLHVGADFAQMDIESVP